MNNLPLRQNLCMQHLILRSAFLGDVHFDQEVVFFSTKHRWNMVKMSCATSDSHSAHIRYCWNRLLWIDATPVLQTLELQTWSVHAVKWKLEHNPCNPPWEHDWPLWSNLFLTACLTFLVTVSSLQCVFCLVLKDCWRADVSTANGDWLVGQLLPYHVTSSRSYLCCSVRCSICSHPSPSHTQAFGKLLILLQEDRYWKVVWFLPNRTAPLIFSKTLLKSSDFFTANDFTQAGLHLVIVAQLSQNEKSGYWDPKGCEGSVRRLVHQFSIFCKWLFGWWITFL